jgi:P4 family phage/plasmid primase-like protien
MSNRIDFKNDMLTKGFAPASINADGKIHRFPTSNKRGDKSGWYVYYPETGAGAYGDWRQGTKYTWSVVSSSAMTEGQRRAFSKRMGKAKKQEKQAKSQARKNAAQKANKLWQKGRPANPEHPYLKKKSLTPTEGTTTIGNSLVIPIKSFDDGNITSLQFIKPNGDKRFLKDGQISGCCSVIKGNKERILVCEGWATGVSLNVATGHFVFIAFNAGNLKKVAEKLRMKAGNRLVICSDNDQWTTKQDGILWNPGKEKALSAGWKYGLKVAIPEFENTETKPTDFNDLASLEGNDVVKQQVEAAKLPREILLEECQNDKGAAFRPEHLDGLRQFKTRNYSAFRALRYELKKLKIGVMALDDAMAKKSDDGSAEQASENPEESAAAEILAMDLKNICAFDKKSEKWFQYKDGYWTEISRQGIKEVVSQIIRSSKLFPMPYKNHFFNGVVELSKNHLIFGSEKKGTKDLLPFKNGVLDIKTKSLEPNDPNYGFTWQLPYSYDPAATCQPILQWLFEMTGNVPELVLLLRAFLNAVLMGYVELHKFLELVGAGGTGKSTFIFLAEQLVGATNTITSDFKYLENNRFETASLYMKKLVLITDAERYTGEVSVLKALTGGDPLRYEEKFKQSHNSFQPEALVIIAANEAIQSKDYTSGLQRRRLPVYLRNQIPEEDRRELKTEFIQFIPGLLNWVLDMNRKEVFSILKSQKSEAQAANFKENLVATNPIAEWLDDNVVYEPGINLKTYIGVANKIMGGSEVNGFENENSKLYPNYVKFCVTHNYRAISLKRFRSLLMDLINNQLHLNDIQAKKDSDGRHVTSIRLRDHQKDDSENAVSPVDAAIMRDEGEI